jgi:hypothetical protein
MISREGLRNQKSEHLAKFFEKFTGSPSRVTKNSELVLLMKPRLMFVFLDLLLLFGIPILGAFPNEERSK